MNVDIIPPQSELISDIKTLIKQSKQQVAVAVNTTITMLYWNIGKRINIEIENLPHSEKYGKQIVATLWQQLSVEYGNSFSEKNLRRMMQFANVFPDEKIVVSLIRQFSWTHFLAVIPIEDPLKRMFYIEMCKIEKWSVRTFRERINSMLYERTAISKKPDKCLIAIDLKIGEFDAAYKGEMELYLSYLEKYESVEGENPPIGLILCTGKNPEHIELLQLHKSNIKVSDYFTILPSKEILLDRLHKAVAIAQNQIKEL